MPPPLVVELPLIIGHRGAAAHAPENTLAGLREAARQGATMVEFDATITGDTPPRVVIFHDDTLERTTNGRGAIDRTPFDTLRGLDAGEGERIPTLEEAVATVQHLGLMANVEIKVAPGRDRETAEAVMAALERCWPKDAPPPFISSFSVEALEIARREQPDWPRGYLLWDKPADWHIIADRLNVATININGERERTADLRDLLSTGRPVLAYTINDPDKARALLDQGIAGLFTDTPRTLLPLVKDRFDRRSIRINAPDAP